MGSSTKRRSHQIGGLLMWFAVLGGALAWAVHVFVAWGADELTCQSGHTSVQGVPLRAVVGAGVVLPALVAAAALLMAWRAWRQTNAAKGDDDPRMERAGMLALLGVCANALFLAIIIAGGAAVLVLAPCQG
ncbi:hypothetical protein [Actinoplanes sp. NPDC026619]|uniref:hypothetical protein n=1 Tax=Actinoplanes sp. NPDC026619 TaxID=3155798 RepID=UPI0033FC889F